KKIYVFFALLILTTVFSQEKLTVEGTLYSTLGSNGVSDIRRGDAKIVFDFASKRIMVQSAVSGNDIYQITHIMPKGITSKGEEYYQVLGVKGTEFYDFRILPNRVLIVNKAT